MPVLWSGFRAERDSSGRSIVEIQSNFLLYLIAAIVAPLAFIGFNLQFLGAGPLGVPWLLVAGPAAVGALAAAILVWAGSRSKVRVTIDRMTSRVIVESAGGRAEIPLGNIAKVEFAASPSIQGNPGYRLEFELRSGERVPATTLYFGGYGSGDREKAVNAIGAELKARSGMLQ